MDERKQNRIIGEIGLLLLAGFIFGTMYIAGAFSPPEPRISRIAGLGQGAEMFREDNQHYPGQRDVDDWIGLYSGSQILAAHLFGYGDDYTNTGKASPNATSLYARYTPGILGSVDGRDNVLLDWQENPMAICYYVIEDPGKPDFDRLFQQNAVHTGRTPEDLKRFLAPLHSPDAPPFHPTWNGRDILFISPGKDRIYFTDDDAKNWN
jgi:hypothetical protein